MSHFIVVSEQPGLRLGFWEMVIFMSIGRVMWSGCEGWVNFSFQCLLLSFSKASVILILQLALLQQVQSDFRLGYISVNIKEILSPERTVQYYSLILFLNSWPFQELILSPPQFALENHVAFFVVPRRVFGNKTKTRK